MVLLFFAEQSRMKLLAVRLTPGFGEEIMGGGGQCQPGSERCVPRGGCMTKQRLGVTRSFTYLQKGRSNSLLKF